jgi:putative DNA primase/helicase
MWEAFQERICNGDRDLIAYKCRAWGYSITGNTSEEVLFIAFGIGANGKSTEQHLIRTVAGDYANVAQFETFAARRGEGIRNDVADLKGSRIVTTSEGDSGQRLAEGLVKQMTGGDPLKARFLHREHFTFTPQFHIWLATNHKPVIRGTDEGIWRRIRLIPYSAVIPPEERDKHLRVTLESEAPGILNWLVRGCLEWQQQGLGEAGAVVAATTGYRLESDTLHDFIDSHCTTGDPTTHYAPFKDLYGAYEQWKQRNGEEAMTAQAFGRALTERGYPPAPKAVKIAGTSTKIRLGISLEGAP